MDLLVISHCGECRTRVICLGVFCPSSNLVYMGHCVCVCVYMCASDLMCLRVCVCIFMCFVCVYVYVCVCVCVCGRKLVCVTEWERDLTRSGLNPEMVHWITPDLGRIQDRE